MLKEEITLHLNLYSVKENCKEFIYKFEKLKDVILYANFCIEDGVNLTGRTTIYVNGDLTYDTDSITYGMKPIELNFDKISKVKN